jgi:TrmH family RNA methyltransferase
VISRNTIKWIKSLQLKKNRDRERLFLVEGKKMVDESLSSDFEIHSIYSTEKMTVDCDFYELSSLDLQRMSSQKSPHQSMALVKYKNWKMPEKGVFIALDDIRDPGNLGTIMRSVNWFGADGIICSQDSVDCYNSKAVRASMGAVFRVPIKYVELPVYLEKFKGESYALDLEGDSLFESNLSQGNSIYVMGNEANGISEAVSSKCQGKIKIPGGNGQESLNVSMATAIVLSEMYRQS